jgi:hypothetical protein
LAKSMQNPSSSSLFISGIPSSEGSVLYMAYGFVCGNLAETIFIKVQIKICLFTSFIVHQHRKKKQTKIRDNLHWKIKQLISGAVCRSQSYKS